MSVIVGAVLLVVAVILFILQPMLSGRRASLHREMDEPTEAESRWRVALLALRDVEYDHATGKLDEADYHALRRELAAEALTALERVDSEATAGPGGAPPALEDEIARLRSGLRSGTTCASCGSGNDGGSSFCAYCGAPLRAAAGGPSPHGSPSGPGPA
jgi:cytochrome c-type biogenesis protein CcmI